MGHFETDGLTAVIIMGPKVFCAWPVRCIYVILPFVGGRETRVKRFVRSWMAPSGVWLGYKSGRFLISTR